MSFLGHLSAYLTETQKYSPEALNKAQYIAIRSQDSFCPSQPDNFIFILCFKAEVWLQLGIAATWIIHSPFTGRKWEN